MIGRSSRDFFDCFPGGRSDISAFRYCAVRGGDGLGGQNHLGRRRRQPRRRKQHVVAVLEHLELNLNVYAFKFTASQRSSV